jgi:large conductance mechanosensitive channel
MRNFIREFKEFAVRGNVVDLAIGIIIGTAFNRVTNSLVSDIVLPPIGALLRRVDFSNMFVTLGRGSYTTLAEAQQAGVATLNYGLFINTIINFVITAFAVFLLVRYMNALRRRQDLKQEPSSPTTKPCPYCLTNVPVKATRCPSCTSQLA